MGKGEATRRPRERPHPNDIRVELFTRFITDADAAKSSSANTSTRPGFAPHELKAFSDDITARFRAWKARFSLLIRALEWCLPARHDESTIRSGGTFRDTVSRVRSFAGTNYAQFIELDASSMYDSQSNDNDNNQNLFMQLAAHAKALVSTNNNNLYESERAALLIVLGSAADNAQSASSSTSAPATTAAAASGDAAGAAVAPTPQPNPAATCSSLRGLLLRNVTSAFLDRFICDDLLKLMIQFRIHRELPESTTAAAAGAAVSSVASDLTFFRPLTHEPNRRFSCVLASSQRVVVIVEPLLAFRQQYIDALKQIVSLLPQPKTLRLVGVVLGDVRDAVFLNGSDLKLMVAEATVTSQSTVAAREGIEIIMSLPSAASNQADSADQQRGRGGGGEKTIVLSDALQLCRISISPSGLYGESADVLSLYAVNNNNNNSNSVPGRRQKILTFSGDAIGIDSFVDGVVDVSQIGHFFSDLQSNNFNNSNNNSLLFPSHSGYSWVTPQLDLAWVGLSFLAKKNILLQNSGQSNNNKPFALTPNCPTHAVLPVASALHGAVAAWNKRLLSASVPSSSSPSPPSSSPSSSLPAFMTCQQLCDIYSSVSPACAMVMMQPRTSNTATSTTTMTPLVLDTRPPRDFEQLRIAGSLTVPFTFPESERGAKKAEIWLSSLLFPSQPLIVVVPRMGGDDDVAAATVRRIRAVIPHDVCPIVGLVTTATLQEMSSNNNRKDRDGAKSGSKIRIIQGASQHFHTLPNYDAVSAALSGARSHESQPRDDDDDDDDDDYSLPASSSSAVVIDCRTPIEFTQGSYVRAVNVPLSDVRNWIVWLSSPDSITHHESLRSWMKSVPSAASAASAQQLKTLNILPARPALFRRGAGSHSSGAAQLEQQQQQQEQFLESEIESLRGFKAILDRTRAIEPAAAAANSITSVVVFCAGGYRSRIFMSILDAALLARLNDSDEDNGDESRRLSRIVIGDVGRGAVELMSQHASTWQVKDRTIMCVS